MLVRNPHGKEVDVAPDSEAARLAKGNEQGWSLVVKAKPKAKPED